MKLLSRLAFVVLVIVATVAVMRWQAVDSAFSVSEIKEGIEALTRGNPTRDGQRIWTDTRGRRITAELLDATPSTVTVKKVSDSRVYKIPMRNLCQADRDYVTLWLKSAAN